MEKLTIQYIAAFGIEGIQFISELDKPYDEYGKQPVWTCNGITYLFGEYCLNTKEGNDAYPISKCKLVLRNISCLTKNIQHEGREFCPIVELAKIALQHPKQPNFIGDYTMYWNQSNNVIVYFEYLPTQNSFMVSRHVTGNPVREIFTVSNQYQLFQKLAEWHIDFLGLIEKGLAIEKDNTK